MGRLGPSDYFGEPEALGGWWALRQTQIREGAVPGCPRSQVAPAKRVCLLGGRLA